jgi:hypothetical protein
MQCTTSSTQFILADYPVFHDQLQIVLGIEHDPKVGERIAFDDQQVGIGTSRDCAEFAFLHEQHRIGCRGRANDIGGRINSIRISNSRTCDFRASGPQRSVPKAIGTSYFLAQLYTCRPLAIVRSRLLTIEGGSCVWPAVSIR